METVPVNLRVPLAVRSKWKKLAVSQDLTLTAAVKEAMEAWERQLADKNKEMAIAEPRG